MKIVAQLTKVREVFLRIAILGLIYPHLGVLKGGEGAYGTLNEKN